MADRLPPYVIPNYSSNLLQQQQQQQQQHQNSQQAQQSGQQQQQLGQQAQQDQQHPSINQSSMDQARMWAQQMQQFRQNAGADVNHNNSAHFAELMKRNLPNQFPRQPQQQQQQPQQQPFGIGLGMPQSGSGPPVLGGNPQQQTFHEQHPSNMSQQSHIPQSFSNMGMSNGSVSAASLPNRTSSGVLPNSQTGRQLEAMNMNQNQNKFSQPSQQQSPHNQPPQFPPSMNQSQPADLFMSPGISTDTLRRQSPHPPHPNNMQQPSGVGQAVQPPQQGLPGPMASGRPIPDFHNRVNVMRTVITTQEANLNQWVQRLNLVRGTNPAAESQFSLKIKEIQMEILKRKEYLSAMIMAWRQQQGMTGGGNGAQPPNQPWMSQVNTAQSFDPSNGQTSRPFMGMLPGQPSHPMQTSPNLQSQNNQLVNSTLGPNRTVPNSQQSSQPQGGGGVGNPFVNGMGGQVPFSRANSQHQVASGASQSIMPGAQGGGALIPTNILLLEKQRFELVFKAFCDRRGAKIDPRLLNMENRSLDVHALHVQVMQEGGFAKIEGNDNLWCIIGGRLGFVQFPGTSTEPAKCGPVIAQSLQHLYKEFIVPFELWYMQESRNKQHQKSLSNNRAWQQLLPLSNFSAAELHAQGIDEKTIQVVENHRPNLQRLFQDQRSFALGVRNSNTSQNMGPGADQNGTMGPRPPNMGVSPFGAGPSTPQQQQNLALSMSNRPQSQQQQPVGQHLQPPGPDGIDPMLARMQQQQQPQMTAHNFPQKHVTAQAAQLMAQLKNNFAMSGFANANMDVPIEQQVEYGQVLEHLHRQCVDTDRKLAPMAVILKDEAGLRRLVSIISTVNQQWNNMSFASGPRYIVNLEELKKMNHDLMHLTDSFNAHFNNFRQHQALLQKQHQGQQPQPHAMSNLMAPPVMNKPEMQQQQTQQVRHMVPQNRPPSVVQQHPPPPTQTPQPAHNQSLRPPGPSTSLQPPLPGKRKAPQTPGSAAVSTPSPAPAVSASTPVASTPTPTATASSPPANTKSPKNKPAPKAKAASRQRRASKVNVTTPIASAVPSENSQPPPAAAATPVSGKRQREEDLTPNSGGAIAVEASEAVNEGSPPKRVKMEWEAQPSEAQLKKNEAIANIQTDEEAASFMNQMKEMIKTAAGSEEEGQQSSLTSDISETLGMLLKGCGPSPDPMGFAGISMGSGAGESNGTRELELAAGPLADAFDEFIDFSFVVDDEDSKTPDLVSSSSTNPSPESNHDAETGHHLFSSTSTDIKTENTSDLLRLGMWREIDNGEATYHQTSEWKWDSSMLTLDMPWAIFNS